MRTLSSGGSALLGVKSTLALLIEMQLTTPIYLTTAIIDIDYAGNTYVGGRGVDVEVVKDQGGELQQLRFSLSGVPSSYIALALSEPIQGKVVKVSTALMDPANDSILDVMPLWSGTLDQMPIKHGAEFSVISVTAESRGVSFSRPKGVRYTDSEQARLYSGDHCLEFLVSQAAHQDTWPSASFFKQ